MDANNTLCCHRYTRAPSSADDPTDRLRRSPVAPHRDSGASRCWALALAVGLYAARSAADPLQPMDEPLVTDRPDFTESTEVVPAGHFQLEAGYTFTYDRESHDRVYDHTAPELLGRWGVVHPFELRFGWAGYSWSQDHFLTETRAGRSVIQEDWSQGANDLSVGFKLKLLEQDGLQPHFAILPQVTLPSGTVGISSGDVDSEVKLLWGYDLTDNLAIAGNLNLAVPTEEAHRFVQTAASLSLALGICEDWGAYLEYFGFYPNHHGSDAAHTLNGGLTYLVSNDFQIDLRAGFGLNEEADDFFAGLGFAWRW